MKWTFTKFLRHLREYQDEEGKFADFLLLRGDRKFFVENEYDFLKPENTSLESLRDSLRGSYPVWSNSEPTITAWVTQNAPDKLETLYGIYDQYRAIADKTWPNPTRQDKPKKKRFEVDFEELRRRARKTYINGDTGVLREVVINETI